MGQSVLYVVEEVVELEVVVVVKALLVEAEDAPLVDVELELIVVD